MKFQAPVYGNRVIEEGLPYNDYYLYEYIGIFKSQEELKAVVTPGNPQLGDIKFKDLNGDGKITADDRTFLGSYVPKFSYALNYSANYKNFDLSLFFQGVQGNKIFNGTRVLREGMARLFGAGVEVLNAWTPTNNKTNIPRAISGDPNQNARVSSRWIEDGSYLRAKAITLGYNIPTKETRKAFKNARVFVTAQNAFTITKYKGYGPEAGSITNPVSYGIDYGNVPQLRAFVAGVQVGF